MYCPHCGKKLKILEFKFDKLGIGHTKTDCKCGRHIEIEDRQAFEQEGLTVIELR